MTAGFFSGRNKTKPIAAGHAYPPAPITALVIGCGATDGNYKPFFFLIFPITFHNTTTKHTDTVNYDFWRARAYIGGTHTDYYRIIDGRSPETETMVTTNNDTAGIRYNTAAGNPGLRSSNVVRSRNPGTARHYYTRYPGSGYREF